MRQDTTFEYCFHSFSISEYFGIEYKFTNTLPRIKGAAHLCACLFHSVSKRQ